MNQALSRANPEFPPLARRFAIHLAGTAVFNVVVALVVTFVMRASTNFLQNLLISMCIGLLAQVFIDGTRMLLWGEGRPPKLPFFALLAVSVPSAYFLGMALAEHLLGFSLSTGANGDPRHIAGPLIVTILACAFGTFMFWNRSKIAQLQAEAEGEKARAAAVEKQALQAQLQMLQAQIEPHMLFNTLANLQGLIAVDAVRAQQMLDQLIQYLRATLASSRSEQASLAHEFTLMEAYLGLMSVRMGARLSYALELPEELRGFMIPPMLLQPLVENAIRHGLEPKVDGGSIHVRAAREADVLKLCVADTGLGLDAAPASSGTRVGVANVRERLGAMYGERASFTLTRNTPSGVIAKIEIPL
jgi:Histidine kinase